MNAKMIDKTRKAFEAWFSSKGFGPVGLLQIDGEYVHTPASTYLKVWRAATAVEQERCALVWLPIADAPKDAYVLLWIDIVIGHPLVVQGCWFHDDDEDEKGWIDLDGKVLHATHWMPLPPPPAIRQGGNS